MSYTIEKSVTSIIVTIRHPKLNNFIVIEPDPNKDKGYIYRSQTFHKSDDALPIEHGFYDNRPISELFKEALEEHGLDVDTATLEQIREKAITL